MADIVEAEVEEDIDDFILAELNCLQVSPVSLDKPISILADNYLDYSRKIAIYLTTLYQSPRIDTQKFNICKKKAIKFKVHDNQLFYENSKNVPMRQVVNDFTERQIIL